MGGQAKSVTLLPQRLASQVVSTRRVCGRRLLRVTERTCGVCPALTPLGRGPLACAVPWGPGPRQQNRAGEGKRARPIRPCSGLGRSPGEALAERSNQKVPSQGLSSRPG